MIQGSETPRGTKVEFLFEFKEIKNMQIWRFFFSETRSNNMTHNHVFFLPVVTVLLDIIHFWLDYLYI